jgi:hypothetical protein
MPNVTNLSRNADVFPSCLFPQSSSRDCYCLFQMPRCRGRKSTTGMWSEVAMSHAIAEYNSGRIKLATATKYLTQEGSRTQS